MFISLGVYEVERTRMSGYELTEERTSYNWPPHTPPMTVSHHYVLDKDHDKCEKIKGQKAGFSYTFFCIANAQRIDLSFSFIFGRFVRA